jgi:hypothetical protein
MTDAAVVRVEAMSPALVIRASVEFASACRPVSGQECFGSAATAWQVESASGAGLAGAAGFLGLVALDEGLLERHGYVGLLGQERSRPVQPGTGVSEPGISGDSNNGSDNGSDNDGSKGANGTKPMNPWDFRTSSPPG